MTTYNASSTIGCVSFTSESVLVSIVWIDSLDPIDQISLSKCVSNLDIVLHEANLKTCQSLDVVTNIPSVGVPFAVTVDSETSVTIRERDSKDQIRENVDEIDNVYGSA
ncbi:glycine--tRNA ligase, mitochondrial 1-like protein [Tanacetum coccineum]